MSRLRVPVLVAPRTYVRAGIGNWLVGVEADSADRSVVTKAVLRLGRVVIRKGHMQIAGTRQGSAPSRQPFAPSPVLTYCGVTLHHNEGEAL